MKIAAIIPGEPVRYLVEATEEELDLVRGAAGTVKIANRYKVGYELQPAQVFQQATQLAKNLKSIQSVPGELQRLAKEMKATVKALEAEV